MSAYALSPTTPRSVTSTSAKASPFIDFTGKRHSSASEPTNSPATMSGLLLTCFRHGFRSMNVSASRNRGRRAELEFTFAGNTTPASSPESTGARAMLARSASRTESGRRTRRRCCSPANRRRLTLCRSTDRLCRRRCRSTTPLKSTCRDKPNRKATATGKSAEQQVNCGLCAAAPLPRPENLSSASMASKNFAPRQDSPKSGSLVRVWGLQPDDN
jgi:hypothetical protein